MAFSLTSEPKIWMGCGRSDCSPRNSSRDGERVDLLAGGAPATHSRIGAPSGLCSQDLGEDVRLQRLEDLRVPEERGDVDEDVLVERSNLVRVIAASSVR